MGSQVRTLQRPPSPNSPAARPVVIEETFPLQAGFHEFGQFITESRAIASGWIGFYWGKTPAERRQSNTIGDAITLGWLELFQREAGKANK